MLWMNMTNGNDLGGGKPVLTGPSIVDKTNIDQILPYTAEQHALDRAPGGAAPCRSRAAPAGPTHPLEQT